jgi:TrmH family RNA methyltransferase
MISKSRIRLIKSLQLKKQRILHNMFIVEGEKMVSEAVEWIPEYIETIYYTSEFDINTVNHTSINTELITTQELKEISTLKTPNKAFAVCKSLHNKRPYTDLIISLDGIQDPGNMGTILRLADWFGISHVICSLDTVDCYNPKVLQATMGAIFRVNVEYVDLTDFLKKNELPIFGALLEGENLFKSNLQTKGIILLGNEGNGIKEGNKKYITHPITIPRYGNAESLNVATAGAIILGSFFQKQ